MISKEIAAPFKTRFLVSLPDSVLSVFTEKIICNILWCFSSPNKYFLIKRPVEGEIVGQIVQKIEEFTDNLEQIKQDIESSFPSLSSEN